MDDHRRTGAFANQVARADVVAVGDEDAGDTLAREQLEHVGWRLDGVDAQVAAGMTDEPAVEVVAVRLGVPRPGDDPVDDLAHVPTSSTEHHARTSTSAHSRCGHDVPGVQAAMPRRIVLDTDIGTDVDDALALALALASPELELVAITTVSGDTTVR